MNWYLNCLKLHYADFKGRARRAEFWNFVLYNFIASFVIGLVATLIKLPLLASLYGLAVLVPGLAVGARRLHDIGKSGLFLLVGLIPVIGTIWLIILFCQDSLPGANQWGNNPKE
ncbi:MAG: DUF805 domain-containing protein [Alistipes sp.]|nr:DUF805 domain-containing protein [Alistipes sp.]